MGMTLIVAAVPRRSWLQFRPSCCGWLWKISQPDRNANRSFLVRILCVVVSS